MKPTLQNGVNLAYWLYKVHPELYARILPLAANAQAKARLGSLGDDISISDSGTTTSFDDSGSTFDLGSGVSDVFNSLTPDIAAISTPDLVNVSVDTSGLTTPAFQTESDPGSIFSAIDTGLKTVGNWLTSATGLSTVGNLATTVIKANTPQQQTVQTQLTRVASGSNVLPITYGYNTAGQVVPILQTGINQGQALTSSTLASLLPSSMKPYAVPIIVGLLGAVVIKAMQGRRG